MGSHSATFHPTQVNIARLNPGQRLVLESIYYSRRDGRLGWPKWPVRYYYKNSTVVILSEGILI